MDNPNQERESFSDFKRELKEMKADFKEAIQLFKEEFINFFNFKGDRLLKIYIVFVLIILPILLTKFIGPLFFED